MYILCLISPLGHCIDIMDLSNGNRMILSWNADMVLGVLDDLANKIKRKRQTARNKKQGHTKKYASKISLDSKYMPCIYILTSLSHVIH